jgi:NTP pyrophosphatase (non-canonical NTP hydrolase)
VNFDDFQRDALRTRNPALDAAGRLLDPACGLAEEAGEVLALVRKHAFQAHPLDGVMLARELGDALWCLAAVADAAGLSLDAIAAANLAKLRARYPEGFSTEASRKKADERESPR